MAASLDHPGDRLQELMRFWAEDYPREAFGGRRALLGFAFQSGLYLLEFFQGVRDAKVEPGRLAEMERLSDILRPADGKFVLIQAKRTLNTSKLKEALDEARKITALCRDKTPDLLDVIRFQVACNRIEGDLATGKSTLFEVIDDLKAQPGADPETWKLVRERFSHDPPILVEADPIDRLHVFLWNDGLANPTGFIDGCLGRLLDHFNDDDPDLIRSVARDLASDFRNASRRTPWRPVGRVLSRRDVEPDPRAESDTGVLTGQKPKPEHVRRGYFRSRETVLTPLVDAFESWRGSPADAAEWPVGKVPVFWIDGRSGEGKSVLLLQLVAKRIAGGGDETFVLMQSPSDLPRLLESVPEPVGPSVPMLAVVDDLYDLRDRESWQEEVRAACSIRTPFVGIVACGPTDQREAFESDLADQFAVTSFQVPKLGLEECGDFRAWFEQRTGSSRDWSKLTTDNVLLVQFMFELVQGRTMTEFAMRFRKRLNRLGVFETVRTVLAVNSLYLDAPASLLSHDRTRDALARLAKEDQSHFGLPDEINPTEHRGLRLEHAHLAWVLFSEWNDPPATLAKTWARDLARAVRMLEDEGDQPSVARLLYAVLRSDHAADTPDASRYPPRANRREMIGELYRKTIETHGGHPPPETLGNWLAFVIHDPGLALLPDPVEFTLRALADPLLAPSIHASTVTSLWKIANDRPIGLDPLGVRERIRTFLMRYPNNRAVCSTLLTIFRPDVDISVLLSWLDSNATHPQAYQLLAALVAAHPGDVAVRDRTLAWLDADAAHSQACQLLASMVAANPGDTPLRNRALQWVEGNFTDPRAHQLLAALIAANPGNSAVRDRALAWLNGNAAHPQAYTLLAPLVKADHADAAVRHRGLQWLDSNPTHPQAYQLLAALVAASPTDAAMRDRALAWLDGNAVHPHTYWLLAPLVKANPGNPAVRDRSLLWLDGNATRLQAVHLLAPLVAANPADAAVRDRALQWLDGNATRLQAVHLLAPLLSANPGDPAVSDRALQWLDGNATRPQAVDLLAPLVAANPGNPAVRDRALQWLDGNATRLQAVQLLAPLVAANPGDAAVRDRAMSWLDANPSDPHTDSLLAPLVAANPADAEIQKRTTCWLDTNRGHPSYETILATMIVRSDGEPTWLRRGEDHLASLAAKDRGGIVRSLVLAGKARTEYVNLVCEYLEQSRKDKARFFVLDGLARALVYNLPNAAAYLQTHAQARRKHQVCRSIAEGLKKLPDLIPSFVDAFEAFLSQDLGLILVWTVRLNVSSEMLDDLIVEWLNTNYKRRGYGTLLSACRKHPSRWAELLARGWLDLRVARDHDALR